MFSESSQQESSQQTQKKQTIGSSTIPARALKDGAHILAEPICFLFNGFFKQNKFLSPLKLANITFLHKKRRH